MGVGILVWVQSIEVDLMTTRQIDDHYTRIICTRLKTVNATTGYIKRWLIAYIQVVKAYWYFSDTYKNWYPSKFGLRDVPLASYYHYKAQCMSYLDLSGLFAFSHLVLHFCFYAFREYGVRRVSQKERSDK